MPFVPGAGRNLCVTRCSPCVPDICGPPGMFGGRAEPLVTILRQQPVAKMNSSCRRMFDVRSPMRDGVELSADIWLPCGEDSFPLILIRTPYLKTLSQMGPKFAAFFVCHGYAVAIQDVRGRGDSDGEFNYHFQEADDGY